jgi:hypothetical protein
MFHWLKGKRDSSDAREPDAPARDLRCSFCQKHQSDVRKLIAGPAVFICDECVEVCVDIMADDARFQDPAGDAAGREASSNVSRSRTRMVGCTICGKPGSFKNMLPIDDRAVLCGACADAVEDALARGRPTT